MPKFGYAALAVALAGVSVLAIPALAWAEKPAKPASAAAKTQPLHLGDYLAARSAQLDHDWHTAGPLMRSVWEANRDDPDLRRSALLFSLAAGNFQAAVTVARAVPPDAGERGLASMVLSVDDLAEGRYPAVLMRLAAIPQEGANRYLVPLLSAWCEVGRGRKDAAMEALKPVEALIGSGELHDLQAAMIAEATGDKAGAAALYGKLAANNASAQVLFLSIQFYQRIGEFDQARKLVDRLDPDGQGGGRRAALVARLNAKVHSGGAPDARSGAAAAFFEIAASLAQQDQQEAVLDGALYTQLALHLRPNYPDAQLLVAQIYEHFSRLADAEQALLSVDGTSDLRSTAEHEAMLDMARDHRVDDALKLGRKAAESHPDDFGLVLDYADLLRGKAQYADAVAVYSGVLARLPANSTRRGLTLFGRGSAYERALDWPHAEADLQAALLLRPNDSELLNYLAFAWVDRGLNLDRAHTMLERALQLSPGNGAFIDSMGWLLFRQGNFQDAVKQLEHAAELDADDATVADHLGDAYWRAGRQTEAHAEWERAARMTDDKDLAEQIRLKLRDGLAATSAPGPRHATAD